MTQVRETEPFVLSHFSKATQTWKAAVVAGPHASPPPPLNLCQSKWVSGQPDLGLGNALRLPQGEPTSRLVSGTVPETGEAGSFSGIRLTPLHVSVFYLRFYSSSEKLSKIRDREMGSWLGG